MAHSQVPRSHHAWRFPIGRLEFQPAAKRPSAALGHHRLPAEYRLLPFSRPVILRAGMARCVLYAAKGASVRTQPHEEFEPADKPVRWYENVLCAIMQALWFLYIFTHVPVARLGTVVAIGLSLAVSLWKLLFPPRLSATRCAFVLIAILGIVLVLNSLLWPSLYSGVYMQNTN